ncbi:DUF2175 domain-containing protein [Thermoplasma sp. Kam2015]|uniref:DUF2175 family protein n=1 Tax=Thermoplasma sp. Kam2015 TaxID=2094122 RepID=UPI000D98FC8D|nr:DUF2175 family protein [Thermoplasma sp. Kam2015]PYB67944.1 DUF2175 domain-containing protein [Thermoplasma sp. Kam2015]
MAEFKCYVCNSTVKTGEKFTFTKKGSVHYDCYVSSKRQNIDPSKEEEFRTLAMLLDYSLQALLNAMSIQTQKESAAEAKRQSIQAYEKLAGDITKKMEEL